MCRILIVLDDKLTILSLSLFLFLPMTTVFQNSCKRHLISLRRQCHCCLPDSFHTPYTDVIEAESIY